MKKLREFLTVNLPGFLKNRKSDVAGIIVFVGVFFLIQWWQTRNLVAADDAAPAMVLTDTEGKSHDLSQYRGRPVVLYFFAPWCSICKITVGNLEYLKKIRGEEGVAILAVALDYGDEEEIRAYKKEHGLSIPVLLGNDGTSVAYKIQGFPTVYFVDEEGRVESSSLGYISTAGLFFRSL